MVGELNHFDHALNAMLLLAYTALKHEDAVGLLTFNHDQPRMVPPRKGVAQLGRLIEAVYAVQPSQQAADYETAVNQLLQRQKRRALIVVLSHLDYQDDMSLLSQLSRLKKHHPVLFASLKQSERDEIQQRPLHTLDDSFTYVGAQLYAQHEQQALQQLTARRILHLNVLPQALSVALINQYLTLKRNGPW